jgi:hypothetical protein
MFGRFWVAAQTADCGLDDDESARILSTDDSDFGDEDGDYPPPVHHTDVHCPKSMDEIIDFYDQRQPYNKITILEDEDD